MMADIIMESIFDKDVFNWHKSDMVKSDETSMSQNCHKQSDDYNLMRTTSDKNIKL